LGFEINSREHVVHIAAHGFETIELFATRAHFDYRDPGAAPQLAEWLAYTRMQLRYGAQQGIAVGARDGGGRPCECGHMWL
jgi:hypothetical protein